MKIETQSRYPSHSDIDAPEQFRLLVIVRSPKRRPVVLTVIDDASPLDVIEEWALVAVTRC